MSTPREAVVVAHVSAYYDTARPGTRLFELAHAKRSVTHSNPQGVGDASAGVGPTGVTLPWTGNVNKEPRKSRARS